MPPFSFKNKPIMLQNNPKMKHNQNNPQQTWMRSPLQGMASPPIPVDPPTIGDLNSISQYLSLLEAELKGLGLEPLAQIEADVSSLNGFVRHLAETLHCLLDADQPVWVREERFPVTRWYECLRKVQVYLEELLRHTDQLGAC
ncbi:leptin-B-like [Gadus macrocephalus]|uniref:leptin-B-like n=1 Tax=Gadus macrocephalus TaxID=80720 RepID=UPI0028CB4655|nr:leptin-B-like [Gadus macrocephalus]